MIVELAGLPGSGKTTHARDIADALRIDHVLELDHALRPLSTPKLLGAALRSAASGPTFALQLLPSAARRGRLAIRRALAVHETCRLVRQIETSTVIDEGPLHRLLWTLSFQIDLVALEHAPRWLPQPDLIVYFCVAPDIALRRLRHRGHARLDGLSDEAALDLLRRYQRVAQQLLPLLDAEVVTVEDVLGEAGSRP